MAYQTRSRDPLLDSDMQAVIEKRGKELIGIALVCLGLAAAAMIGSYTPDDPNWMVSTDAPVQNWLGRLGASIAAPLFMVVGGGSWGIALVLIGWGLRYAFHSGEERAVSRLIFAPIAIALGSVYAATLVPGDLWRATHSFGLGGLFGDTVVGALLTLLPLGSHFAVKLLSLLAAGAMLGMGAYVLGFTRPEIQRALRFIVVGLIMVYGFLASLLGKGGVGAAHVARRKMTDFISHRAERRERVAAEKAYQQQIAWEAEQARAVEEAAALAAAEEEAEAQVIEPVYAAPRAQAPIPVHRAQSADYDLPPARMQPEQAAAPRVEPRVTAPAPVATPVSTPAPAPVSAPAASAPAPAAPRRDPQPAEERVGFLSRMPSLLRRSEPAPEPMPASELVEAECLADDQDMPGNDRIRAKIADAIRARSQSGQPVEPEPDPTRPLTKGRGHGPKPLLFNPLRRVLPSPQAEPQVPAMLPPEPPVTAAQAAIAPQPDIAMPEPVLHAPEPVVPSAPELDAHPAPQPQGQPGYSDPYAEAYEAAYAESYVEYQEPAQVDYALEPAYQPAPSPTSVPADAAVEYVPQPVPEVAPQPIAAAASLRAAIPPAPEPRKVVQPPVRKPVQPSRRAQAEAQPGLTFEEHHSDFELPPLGLLANPSEIERHYLSDEALEENARMLENVLDDYGVKGEIVSVRPGPVVTMYELEPAPGLKASRVIGLADDIARSMSALSARVSTVPGRSVIGIELPNENREKVVLREILAARDFGDSKMSLPLALGKDIGGDPVVANLAKMPHLLIAGTTGSGKSVAINTMILSLLYKLTPEECRLIMIDPKMLELSVYDGIPHLLSPVVTDPKKAVVALKWTVGEMEDRYRKMSKMGVRNIEGYNGRVRDALSKGEMFSRTVQTGFDDDTGEPVFETEEFQPVALPYIVVIVDEMADLMMVAGKEIEACIQRLAQMARASGIHLIMATQRPSVDVITGTIKANFPTRISFQVTSKVDSRTILGEQGAEQLLGMGDMLYMAGGAKITRCHGPFVSDEEVEEVVTHLKQFGPPDYIGNVLDGPDDDKAESIDAVLGLSTGGNTDGEDALYDAAVQVVIKDRKCSTSYIQRKLAIGYNKAARLVEQMEEEGLVSPANHVGKREILVPEQ
ncbi:DNA translocase FtsK [Pseudodonghicola xiamenensis]|uniref:DNA translocase FtsK n=1 Tax=Pseudodonghicola xiamenensis TaxID=337702 RepID=A0A8J3H602_9RHOB|nr:DNA translocase FtsK [Pseudodonghicola xiamenensis]GHG83633.1 hypothetical protein GCM10010961_09180 [Pseudodonghicola xiamenensis]